MTKTLSEFTHTIHELPQALLDKPLTERFKLALEHWLDLYPGSTSLRYGKDNESGQIYLAENLYGPRLEVMNYSDYHASLEQCKVYNRRLEESEHYPDNIAKQYGVHLQDWMASDPSVEMDYHKPNDIQGQFRKELAIALNYALGQIGCISHKIEDRKGALQWKARDTFADALPPASVFTPLKEFFNLLHPVQTHVSLGSTIEVKSIDDGPWIPMERVVAEREFIKAKEELSNPEHPWMLARARGVQESSHTDSMLYAYIASKHPSPLSRNGSLLFKGTRFDSRSDTHVGYVVVGTESCGTSGVNRDLVEIMNMASRGQLLQHSFSREPYSDVLMSMAYHAQVFAHQKERALWAASHPQEFAPGTGPLMPKNVADLQVGDFVGAAVVGNSVPSLWCEVTKREDNILTLFVQNGHWDFKLDLSTNAALPHDFMSNFEGSTEVVYTAPVPITDPALYADALRYMEEHVESQMQSSAFEQPSL